MVTRFLANLYTDGLKYTKHFVPRGNRSQRRKEIVKDFSSNHHPLKVSQKRYRLSKSRCETGRDSSYHHRRWWCPAGADAMACHPPPHPLSLFDLTRREEIKLGRTVLLILRAVRHC